MLGRGRGAWSSAWGCPPRRADRAVRAAERGRDLASALGGARCDRRSCTRCWPRSRPEALALALAFGAPEEPVLEVRRPTCATRGSRSAGDDLLAEGVPESPAIGEALAETLRRKLDGEVAGRDEELRTAVELARGAP